MPRALRFQEAGYVHHVTNKGNNGQVIFRDRSDYAQFLSLVEKARKVFPLHIYNYVLMPSYFHLLLEPQEEGALSKFMETISKDYAKYFNKKYQQQGHVFQGRFKSFLIQTEKYFFACSRYIDFCPVQAKLVSNPKEYEWSGFSVLGHGKDKPMKLDRHPIYTNLGFNNMEREISYRAFVMNYQGEEIDFLTRRAGILGDAEFKKKVKVRS